MAISEAHKRATNKWNKENYDRLQLVVPKCNDDDNKITRDMIKARASALGLSVNQYILRLIEADLSGSTLPTGGSESVAGAGLP